ncbi:MAG: hypothetical protein FWD65_02635 [Coriobacteriia bacterium]|nr:hypothetical protein [Coriobacteriia bacterium]
MKKHLVVLALCLALVTGLMAGCGAAAPKVSSKDTVSTALDAYKAGDLAKFASYWSDTSNQDLEKLKNPGQLFADEGINEQTAESLLKGISAASEYKIISGTEDAKTKKASVVVEVTGVDLNKLSSDEALQAEMTQQLMTNPNITKMTEQEQTDAMFDLLIKSLSTTTSKTTKQVTVELVMVSDKGGSPVWKISNDTLLSPLFGNMQ